MNPFSGWGLKEVTEHQARIAASKANKNLGAGIGQSEVQTTAPPVDRGVRSLFSIQPCTDEAKLNKTERAYLGILRSRNHQHIGIQDITLKIADDCRYCCDFNYITASGEFVFVEVKGGFVREDGWLKLKIAARKFRMFKFMLAQKKGGSWTETEVNP